MKLLLSISITTLSLSFIGTWNSRHLQDRPALAATDVERNVTAVFMI